MQSMMRYGKVIGHQDGTCPINISEGRLALAKPGSQDPKTNLWIIRWHRGWGRWFLLVVLLCDELQQ